MCGLLGFKAISSVKMDFSEKLAESLLIESVVRGDDASGYSYLVPEGIVTIKDSVPGYKLDVDIDKYVKNFQGHTRNITQGSAKFNGNNHPFEGILSDGSKFSLSHNGVLDDAYVRDKLGIPQPEIDTDSYLAVQLAEMEGDLSLKSLVNIGENLIGSFTLTLMHEDGTMAFIRRDNPISFMYFREYKLYVYASTKEILWDAVTSVPELDNCLKNEIFQGESVEVFTMPSDSVLVIDNNGRRHMSHFESNSYEINPYLEAVTQGYGVGYNMHTDDEVIYIEKYVIPDLISIGFTREEATELLNHYGVEAIEHELTVTLDDLKLYQMFEEISGVDLL